MAEFFLSPESQRGVERELARRQQRFESARARVTEAQGERLRYISEVAPTASNQLKQAYATSQMTDDQFQQLALREAQRQPETDEGGFLAGLGTVINDAGMGVWDQVIKPAVRGIFTAWDGVQEEVVKRPLTSALAAADPETSFGDAYQQYGDSAFTNILQGDLAEDAEGGSLGTGLFPGGQAQARSNQERTLQIRGQRGDLGQASSAALYSDHGLFGDVYQPGDTAYDITAGVAGFFGEVVLDPVAWGTMGLGAGIKAAKGVTGGSRTLGSAIRTISPNMARKSGEQVAAAGLVSSGRRSTVLLDQAQHLFHNRKVLDEIAAANEYTIWRKMRLDRLGLGRGDNRLADMVTDLADTTDPAEVARKLIEAAERGYVRERGFYKGVGKFVPNPKQRFRDMRLSDDSIFANAPEFRFGGLQPEQTVSVDNKMDAVRSIDGVLRLGKVGEADRAAIVSRAFRAQTNDEMLGVVDDVVRAQARAMDRIGVTREQAARSVGKGMDEIGENEEIVDILVKSHRDSISEQTGYMLDRAGQPNPPPWARQRTVKMGDLEVDTASIKAGFIMNLNKRGIPIPDANDIRRATSKYKVTRDIYQSNGWAMTHAATRGSTRYLFKFPTLFTRYAYPVRNNLENAARIAGAGFASIFSGPRQYFAMGVLDRDKFRDLIMAPDDALVTGRGFRTVEGRYGVVDEVVEASGKGQPSRMRGRWKDTDETFDIEDLEEFRRTQVAEVAGTQDDWALGTKALTDSASGMWSDDGAKALGTWRTYRKGQKGDIRAWRQQLGRLANDPIASRVANSSRYATRDELVDDIIGSGLLDDVSKLGDDARRFFMRQGDEADRARVNEYVDWVDENISILTGDDGGLREAIAFRQLNGVNFNDMSKAGDRRVNQILREQYYDRMPAQVMGDTFIEGGSRGKQAWKGLTDGIVDHMATKPENHFTRAPLLAQVFADDLARSMSTLANDGLRRQLVKRAAEAGYEGKYFKRISQAAQDASGVNGIADNLDDIIDAAKYHATDQTLNIAFDATQRSSFQEAFDAFVPFWDAFAEIGQSWGRLMRDNPNIIGRGMQVFQGASESGFVYTNEFGEEVFAMPGGAAIANVLGLNGGKPLFEAPVEGLNLITQGFGPGVGPLVQWAAGAFLPDTPDVQWARDIITPYGTTVTEPSDLLDLPGLLGELRPAWMTKTFNAFSEGEMDPVAWQSAAGDALKVLGTSGAYDLSDPEEHLRLQADAEKAAKWTMLLRGALQMGAPTGPGVTWEVETDPDGTTHRLNTMASAWYELYQASGDTSSANMAFIDTYGVEPFWITQGKTNQVRPGPRTREGYNWIGRHPEAAERHRDVIGYFVPPEDPEAPPDYGVYRQRLESGDIEPLNSSQQTALSIKNKARSMYNVVRDRTEALPYGLRRRALSDARAALDEQFPGWRDDVLGVGERPDQEAQIRKLAEAANDPDLADSPVTDPLRAYMGLRQQAMDELDRRAAAGGAKTLGAQANRDLADWLYDRGQTISQRAPAFQGVWRRLLSSEVE